jgi:hypothetical protein
LIQFPPEITLDNGVFLDDQIEVSSNKVGLRYTEKETRIAGINTNCMTVYWKIEEKKADILRLQEVIIQVLHIPGVLEDPVIMS